ncbi:MAG: protein tyrosine phosphatase family protein [Nitrosomonas sp.]|nr:protein tyrosine phosphatase family protein [Nitrosomonas sp.]MDP1950760.1 protein tyrosine phosphatase family protein [Nitrosomonas sp.]
MKISISITILLGLFLAGTAFASNQMPFGSQAPAVKNYNRATSQIATSGIIGEEGIKVLAVHGFKTIIDLRTEAEGTHEEKLAVEATGMRYVNIPVTGTGINDDQLTAFTKTIEATQTPVLVHCGSGNRAGALWATYRISKGVAPEIALEEGRTAGMGLEMEQKVKAALQK